MVDFEDLDAVVTWMRKRGIGQMTRGNVSVTLATLVEPAEVEEQEEAFAKLTPEQMRDAMRAKVSQGYYPGPVRPVRGQT